MNPPKHKMFELLWIFVGMLDYEANFTAAFLHFKDPVKIYVKEVKP